jgi:hypothetical protein
MSEQKRIYVQRIDGVTCSTNPESSNLLASQGNVQLRCTRREGRHFLFELQGGEKGLLKSVAQVPMARFELLEDHEALDWMAARGGKDALASKTVRGDNLRKRRA